MFEEFKRKYEIINDRLDSFTDRGDVRLALIFTAISLGILVSKSNNSYGVDYDVSTKVETYSNYDNK